ncbi:MAG: type IV pilin protein [Magnetococcales bacterium]|nr:type IV pilin protein [Magnetococcales bacterium]
MTIGSIPTATPATDRLIDREFVGYIVMAIAVLVGIACYEYPNVMLVWNRQDGRDMLVEVIEKQDKFYKSNRKYATTLEELGYADVQDFAINSRRGFYKIVLSDGDGLSYTLAAEPQGEQVGDARCAPLTYTSKGRAKSSRGSSGSGCW